MEQIVIPPINWAVATPLLLIFGLATALLMIDTFFVPAGRKYITGYAAILALLFTGIAVTPLWNVQGTTFSGMLTLDRYSLALTWIFLLVGAISVAMSLDYLPRQGYEQGEFYPLVLFAVGGMVLLAQGTNLIALFLGIELLSITLYILTGFAYPRLTSEEAAMKYLVLGAFAAGFFVYGIALFYGATGTVDLAEIGALLRQPTIVAEDRTLLLAGSALVLVAFSFKVALAPFHMWTPDVYEGSPTPVTAFMSVGTKGAAFAALLRILQVALPTQSAFWLPVLGALAVATMLVGNIGALAQSNVKRMLAYSSIAHAGYIALAVMTLSARGIQGFLFYLLAYGLTNLGAFAVLIALERRGESAWSLDDFSGLFRRQPLLALAMAVFMLSLAGVPPTAGFFGKFYVFTAAYEAGLGGLALVGVLTSAVAAFFYLRVVIRMFMEEPVRETQPQMVSSLTTGIVIAALGTLIFGLIPTPLVAIAEQALIALGG